MTLLEGYISLLFVLMILSSVVYKVNIFSKFASHTMLAVGISNLTIMAIMAIKDKILGPLLSGEVTLIIPLMLGILVLTQFYKPTSWLSRIPIAFSLGVSTGIAFRGRLESYVIKQITATIGSISDVSTVIILVIVVLVSYYFLFTVDKQKGNLKEVTKIARLLIMMGFGALFASMILGRMGRLVGVFIEVLQNAGVPV